MPSKRLKEYVELGTSKKMAGELSPIPEETLSKHPIRTIELKRKYQQFYRELAMVAPEEYKLLNTYLATHIKADDEERFYSILKWFIQSRNLLLQAKIRMLAKNLKLEIILQAEGSEKSGLEKNDPDFKLVLASGIISDLRKDVDGFLAPFAWLIGLDGMAKFAKQIAKFSLTDMRKILRLTVTSFFAVYGTAAGAGTYIAVLAGFTGLGSIFPGIGSIIGFSIGLAVCAAMGFGWGAKVGDAYGKLFGKSKADLNYGPMEFDGREVASKKKYTVAEEVFKNSPQASKSATYYVLDGVRKFKNKSQFFALFPMTTEYQNKATCNEFIKHVQTGNILVGVEREVYVKGNDNQFTLFNKHAVNGNWTIQDIEAVCEQVKPKK